MVIIMLACNPLHQLYNTVESCPVFHKCMFEQLYACASSTSISRHVVVRIWNADFFFEDTREAQGVGYQYLHDFAH